MKKAHSFGAAICLLAAVVFLGKTSFVKAQSLNKTEIEEQSEWVQGQGGIGMRLLNGGHVSGSGVRLAGVEVKLEPGWHSYWKVPGDAGLPPRFDWSGTEDIDVTVQWPVPRRIDESGFQVFGYEGDLIFPVLVKAKAEEDVRIDLNLEIMVCKDICIPEHLKASILLPGGSQIQDTAHTQNIVQNQDRVPREKNPSGEIHSVVIGPGGIVVTTMSQKGFENIDLFPTIEKDQYAFTAPPKITVDARDPERALILIPRPPETPDLQAFLDGKKLSVTLRIEEKALKKDFSF